jgi:sigma-B regulation protein RsbU (phosphoserine phosphatase)
MELNGIIQLNKKFDKDTTKFLQDNLIDFQPIKSDHFEIAGFNRSYELLGGDYIGLIRKQDGSFLISIGDVMGKGLRAGLLTAMIHGALKGISGQELEPHEILTCLNIALIRDFQRFNAFATFLVSIYDEKSRVLRWANAGQNFPLLWKKRTKQCRFLDLKGVMIGMIEPLNTQTQKIQLEEGDVVLWYSDGLVELFNERRQKYGIERVIQCVEEYGIDGIPKVIEHLKKDVYAFCGNFDLSDDVSFIAMKAL